jgi:uncharacterized membrane protein YeaQ/YmgE (transglycosylase-associated protein family)
LTAGSEGASILHENTVGLRHWQLLEEDRIRTVDWEARMQFLWMCIIGLVAGALAKLIMPGRDPGGIIITMLLGIAGAVIAGFLGRTLGWYQEGEGAGLIMSIIGAILLLALYRMLKGGSARARS